VCAREYACAWVCVCKHAVFCLPNISSLAHICVCTSSCVCICSWVCVCVGLFVFMVCVCVCLFVFSVCVCVCVCVGECVWKQAMVYLSNHLIFRTCGRAYAYVLVNVCVHGCCAYVRVRAYVCVCVCKRAIFSILKQPIIETCMCASTCVCCAFACVCGCTRVCARACVRVCVRACMCVCMWMCVSVSINARSSAFWNIWSFAYTSHDEGSIVSNSNLSCVMTHSYVWHDPFIRVAWLMYVCDLIQVWA